MTIFGFYGFTQCREIGLITILEQKRAECDYIHSNQNILLIGIIIDENQKVDQGMEVCCGA